LRSHFSILFFLIAFSVCGQESKPDTVKTDSVKNKYLPTGVRLGTDVLALVKNNVQASFKGWEVNADVDFNRYFLALDYGTWGRTYISDSSNYSNKGNYWRIGADVNFLTKDPERNMFFIGMRYGHSAFSENLSIITKADPVWGSITKTYENINVRSRWLELTTGIRVHMWKMIWMGYTARLKFGLKNKGDDSMLPHDVPGFGRTDKPTYWGFNYQIFIRLPFREYPPLPNGKKK
jgi:hypothetical protein